MPKPKKKAKAGRGPGEKRSAAGNTQGVTAGGNALRTAAITGLLIMLVTLGLSFAYLVLLREPILQAQQIDRVSASFATQQATNIHGMFARMVDRIRGAAQSPLALSAIASQSNEDIALVEQAMLDYFPEVVSLRIIPVGEMGTADFERGSQGLRNHIEVDLVRRAADGDATRPEAYQFEGNWLTAMAALVTHPRIAERRAVILATIDNQMVSEQLKSLDTAVGKSALVQLYESPTGIDRQDVIAAAGAGSATEYSRHASIPDTTWRVTFTPSAALLQELALSPVPLLAVLALCVLAAIVACLLVVVLFSRALTAELDKIMATADRKSALELQIPQLVPIAGQLRRASSRSSRQLGAATSPEEAATKEPEPGTYQGSELTNPMFQKGSILDEEDEDGFELDLTGGGDVPEAALVSGEGDFPGHIFRAYDIRGVARTELTEELVTRIGRAIGSIAGDMDEQTIVVACDGRDSSPRIKATLVKALMETGRDVVDLGLVPTPLLYFATRHTNFKSGIMVTGSHNPAQDNGLKIVLGQKTIAAGGIQKIRDRVIKDKYSKGAGRMIRENIVPAYLEEVSSDIAIAVPLKIVIDAGNGATGAIAPELFEELGCEVVPLYCEVDGSFPNHPPDTSNEDNLADLVGVVQREGADFGVAFDGDGDRLAVVTSSGKIVRSDVLLMIYAQDVVSRNPGADVVFDVKCSRNLTHLITRHGGRPVLWKTGHAFMKEKMVETGALLGGEFSGHMFFGERWYGFDDGMYAAARLAEIISTHGDSLDTVIAAFPATVSTPEILIPVDERKKFSLVEKLISDGGFSNGKVNTMDGIRVDFNDGWGLVRASNTSAALTARFEADTEEALEVIKAEFRAQISRIEPGLELNF